MSTPPNSEVLLRRAGPIAGTHVVPGDKSISHRAAMFAALAEGRSRIGNFASSEDCWSTVGCLRGLGVRIDADGGAVVVEGRGRDGLARPDAPLDAGNSGTTMRLLAGVLAGTPVEATLDGDESLRRRPMERVAVPLRRMGADVRTTDGRPPVTIVGRRPLGAIDFEPDTPSAQVKSAVLIAGLAADGRTRVAEPVRTRDHTERLLRAFGAAVGEDTAGPFVEGPCVLTPADFEVPGDFSSAAFLFALALMVPGSDVTVSGVGLNPTRTRLLDILSDLGASVEVAGVRDADVEPAGDVRVRLAAGELAPRGGPLVLDGAAVAEVIDEVPILAVLATRVRGGIRFTGAGDLRKKESDRIAAVADNLRRMGVDAVEAPDGLAVPGPVALRGAAVDSFGDHRIAMAFACAAMVAEGDTVIRNPSVVGVSFPGFFGHLPDGAVSDAG